MKNYLKTIFQKPQKDRPLEFGAFFRDASSATKKDVFSRIMENVNKEQREVVRRYGK